MKAMFVTDFHTLAQSLAALKALVFGICDLIAFKLAILSIKTYWMQT